MTARQARIKVLRSELDDLEARAFQLRQELQVLVLQDYTPAIVVAYSMPPLSGKTHRRQQRAS